MSFVCILQFYIAHNHIEFVRIVISGTPSHCLVVLFDECAVTIVIVWFAIYAQHRENTTKEMRAYDIQSI